LAFGTLFTLVVTKLQARAEAGSLTLSFGALPAAKAVLPSEPVQLEGLKADLVKLVEEKSHQEHLLWVQEIHKDLARSNRSLTQRQRKLLETALASLETRLNDRILNRELAMQANWTQAASDLYQKIQTQRKQDWLLTNDHLDRLAVQGEIRSNQTEVILDTLLQMAQLKMN
jgi:hypothetical protein